MLEKFLDVCPTQQHKTFASSPSLIRNCKGTSNGAHDYESMSKSNVAEWWHGVLVAHADMSNEEGFVESVLAMVTGH